MAFSKAFNEDERSYIRRHWGYMTSGDIARELNEKYKTYNEGKRTADGVRRYIADMTGGTITVNVELTRGMKDILSDNGQNPSDLQKAITEGVSKALSGLDLKNSISKSGSAKRTPPKDTSSAKSAAN
jgi:hypothetical protein